MRQRVTVPALRDDFRVKRAGGERFAVEDTALRVRVPIDAMGLAVLQQLADGPRDPAALCKAVGAPRIEVFERVALLNRHLLLDTPRARQQITLHAEAAGQTLWPQADAEAAPLETPPDLAHGCVACGACCTGTDVGPIPEEDVARVRELDWSEHLPDDVTPDDWFQHLEDRAGNPITLLGMRHGRCVFLGDDKLCVIHSVAGPQQKPVICRQFPYTFTRTPHGIDVSFSMECRSWWQARQRGGPVREDEPAIRLLLRQGAPVLDLPMPVPVWDGLAWDLDTWLAVRDEMIARVRVAEDLSGLVRGLTEPVVARLDATMAGFRESEAFATRHGWGIPEVDAEHVAVNFVETCGVVRETVAAALRELSARYNAVFDQAQTDRVRRLAWVFDHVLSGNRLDDIARFSAETEIWRDMVLASLYGHEPARRVDVLTGTAALALRVIMGHRLAGLLARTALRARTVEQDVVDSMVALTKMLRGTALLALFRRRRRQLVDLFLFNPDVFIQGAAPTPPHPAALLPGAG